MLVSSSVSVLQQMLAASEVEFVWLNMEINYRKSACIRIGSRCDKASSSICTAVGHDLLWDTKLKYLGICILSSLHLSAISVIVRSHSIVL